MTTKSDYIQPSATVPVGHAFVFARQRLSQPPLAQYDSSQSPLALLAQTCSSIGKDCSFRCSPPPSIKPSSSVSHPSRKRPSSSQPSPAKKACRAPPSIVSEPLPDVFLRSPFSYFSLAHSYCSPCAAPDCLQCQTTRYLLSNSLLMQPYVCDQLTCAARFSSQLELLEHVRQQHSPVKGAQSVRFSPYLKPTKVTGLTEQLPFFYPQLSLSAHALGARHSAGHEQR